MKVPSKIGKNVTKGEKRTLCFALFVIVEDLFFVFFFYTEWIQRGMRNEETKIMI